MTNAIKLCVKCQEEKPLSGFSKKSSSKDGLQSQCRVCKSLYNAQWLADHPGYQQKKNKEYYDADVEYHRARAQKWRENNPDRAKDQWKCVPKETRREQNKNWRKKRPEHVKAKRRRNYMESRERELEKAREWKRNNVARCNYLKAKRTAAKLRATPSWANQKAIQAFYKESARLTELTGIAHHVDHIVPLQSPWVCGLHCEANLQILPYYENQSKSNRYWPDMPDLTDVEPLKLAA